MRHINRRSGSGKTKAEAICKPNFVLCISCCVHEKTRCLASSVASTTSRINRETMLLLWLLTSVLLLPWNAAAEHTSEHTSNWAVLVCTSRFWFNYRHIANALSLYRTVKRLGIPDSQIIVMVPDDMACNPRNTFPGTVYNNADRALDLYGDNIEVDYRGYEVTVESFIRLLTDRHDHNMPRSKRLLTDERSNILIYMTGHGGNEFLKFQDTEEISAFDIANTFSEMHQKNRYHEILFMIDTCQANTMYTKFTAPNVIATGSSEIDQSSYSHHADQDVGVAVIDRYTYFNLDFLESQVKNESSKLTLGDLFDSYDEGQIHSKPGFRYDLLEGGEPAARSRLVTDFFGNVQNVEVDGRGRREGSEKDEGLGQLIAALRDFQEKAKVSTGAETVRNTTKSTPPPHQDVPSGNHFLVTKDISGGAWKAWTVTLSLVAGTGAMYWLQQSST